MSKKHKRRRLDKRGFKLKLKKDTAFSIAQIIFFSLAGLVLISFSRSGAILMRFNDLVIHYFSWSSIFLPFIFLSFGLLVSKAKLIIGQPNVVVGSLLLFISFMSLGKSGTVGHQFWEALARFLTSAGAGLVLFGTMLIGLIVLFNTSIDHVFKLLVMFLKSSKKYIYSGSPIKINGSGAPSFLKSSFKVIGGQDNNKSSVTPTQKTENVEVKPKLVSNPLGESGVWEYPPLDILSGDAMGTADRGDIKGNAASIEKTLESFRITAHVVEVNKGPAVTQYAIEVAQGTKLSKITALERDLALALAAPTGTIRIEAPIPGRSLVGIELPNRSSEFVSLKEMLESDTLNHHKSKLAVALGLDVSGRPIVADIAKMPHVLIAGQTGSGKSVCINAFLASILFRASPSEVKLILVDPKRVELTGYRDIPHLIAPVIVEPEKVIKALEWTIEEMNRRYKLFAEAGVKNLEGYNEMSGFQALPYIVVVIDELADIMLFSPTSVEGAITKIAQMSRATGIHMVLATQRPSVDVITGLIKANVPSRIAFAVSSQIDSRVILDAQGAEKLLGKGDMLYLPPEQAKPMRIQGAFVTDKEINSLVSFVKGQGSQVQYIDEITNLQKANTITVGGIQSEMDDRFEDAVRVICDYKKASVSLLQRRLNLGYSRAAKIIDQLEEAGAVGPQSEASSKGREVLIESADDFLASLKNKNQQQ